MDYNGKLTVEISKGSSYVRVSVQDNGSGIPEEIKPLIFEPLFTTKEAGEGSGLGLDIVNKIIRDHGGKIEFESKEGEGTTFIVQLPLEDK